MEAQEDGSGGGTEANLEGSEIRKNESKETLGPTTLQSPSKGPSKGPSNLEDAVQIHEEEPDSHWTNKREYLLVLMGAIIDMWRFPYLVKKNGGVVFLIPCTIFLFVAGIPVFFLELALGQSMQRGAIGSWSSISPYLSGIGIASGFICVFINIYYNNIFAWSISYFIWSFSPVLPWSVCQNHTSTKTYLSYNGDSPLDNYSQASEMTSIVSHPKLECELAGPTKYYWFRETLDISSDIGDYGSWNWFVAIFLIVAWTTVYLSLIRGPQSSGKVAYYATIFPYAVLLIFFIGGFFLGEFSEGFYILFAPDWSKLLDGKVWLDAGTQIAFALCLGYGVCVALASYQPRSNNLHFEAYLLPILCFLTQIMVACTFFIILGYKGIKEYKECLINRNDTVNALLDIEGFLTPDFLSHGWSLKSINMPDHDHFISKLNVSLIHENGSEIDVHIWGDDNNTELIYCEYCDKEQIVKATASGSGLVFITFCEAVSHFPIGQIWSILFFLVMITLGICATSGTVEGIVSCLVDCKFKVKRWAVILGVNIFLTIFTVVLFSPGNGLYIFAFLDELCAGWPLLSVSLVECLSISYYYGLEKFSREITLMTGIRPNSYLLICWKFISPLTILIILLFSIIYSMTDTLTYKRWREDLGRNEDKPWDSKYLGLSVLVDLLIIIWMPLMAILAYFKIYLLRDPPPIFPEGDLMVLRHYDPEKDRRNTSWLQRVLMKWNFSSICPKKLKLKRKSDWEGPPGVGLQLDSENFEKSET